MALLLALARNVPQAHAALVAGRWERSKLLRRRADGQDARHPRLRPHRPARRPARAWASACASSPTTRSSAPSATASSASSSVERSDDVYAQADFITLHLPKTPETEGWLDAEAFAKMQRRRAHPQRRPRPADRRRGPAATRSTPARSGGAALDVFRSEPITEHPLFGYPNVVVTPHLGASTAEATDRAGYQAAEQVVAALTGGSVTSAVNVPAVAAEDLEVLGPFLPLCAPARAPRHDARRGRPRSTASRSSCSAASPSATPGRWPWQCCSACCRDTPRRTSTPSTPRRSPRSAGSSSSRRRAARRATSPTSCA